MDQTKTYSFDGSTRAIRQDDFARVNMIGSLFVAILVEILEIGSDFLNRLHNGLFQVWPGLIEWSRQFHNFGYIPKRLGSLMGRPSPCWFDMLW
jgi:hypothetical protein